jgi:thiamine-phosphate diphosphorylase
MATNQTARVTRETRSQLLHGIYVIVNEGERDPLEITRAALTAGVRIIQYRAKRGIDMHRLRALRAITREHDALLIVNDDWQAAIAFNCDGAHLGPDDSGFANVASFRDVFGERLIGLSCGTVAEAEMARAAGVDYVGVGAVYATGSKADAGAPIGIEGLKSVAAAAGMPVAAIGGIDVSNVGQVRDAGVAMAAVISAVANDAEPGAAAAQLVSLWNDS